MPEANLLDVVLVIGPLPGPLPATSTVGAGLHNGNVHNADGGGPFLRCRIVFFRYFGVRKVLGARPGNGVFTEVLLWLCQAQASTDSTSAKAERMNNECLAIP